jgi:hypothetical protein
MGNFDEWKKQVDVTAGKLLINPGLLNQYSMWLETSEENPKLLGENVYNMLMGAMQAVSGVDFIPGIGNRNFVAVLALLQKRTGLDLGLCKFLEDDIEGIERGLRENTKATYSQCSLSGILQVDYSQCTPPGRCMCPYRIDRLSEELAKE